MSDPDRRLTPFSGHFALESLRGKVAAQAFIRGEPARLIVPLVDLVASPGALRERQVIFGAALTVIERRAGLAFVQAAADGYCGWLPEAALGPALVASHVVNALGSHVYREPSIKRGEVMALGIGARLAVEEITGRFARIAEGWVPRSHIRPIEQPEADPVAVAERLLGTPYLWGGNSRDGIDCSGLVQLALTLCGIGCPADSDQQRAAFGAFLPEGARPERGDLLFWPGHVAMAVDGTRLIHANGQTMTVAHEDIDACIARIDAAGEGPLYGIKRP